MPTRRELCEGLGCSSATLQQAMNLLTDEGFIVSMTRNGTVVSETSPHLTEIAIVFPEASGDNRFWTALGNEAIKPRDDGFNLRCWYGIDEHIKNPDRLQLEQDVLNGRLAGIFFASSPHFLVDSPLLMQPRIARVAFGTEDIITRFQQTLSVVSLKGGSFSERAITRLLERGRRRLAVVNTFGTGGYEKWSAATARNGCELPPWAYHEVDQKHALTARYLARLLFRESMPDRPDGLIITDDNLVEQVTLGLADAGVNVPEDLDIVAHCNFPWPPPSALPVTRLGFDAHRILEEGLCLLRETIAGAPPAKATVEAVFEEELERGGGEMRGIR